MLLAASTEINHLIVFSTPLRLMLQLEIEKVRKLVPKLNESCVDTLLT
jgi:hypothetical protein